MGHIIRKSNGCTMFWTLNVPMKYNVDIYTTWPKERVVMMWPELSLMTINTKEFSVRISGKVFV